MKPEVTVADIPIWIAGTWDNWNLEMPDWRGELKCATPRRRFSGTHEVDSKKRQIKSFDLPMTCDKIVRFYFAGFTECKGDKDYLEACGKSVTLSSTIEVGFSDE